MKNNIKKYFVAFGLIVTLISCGDLGSNRPSKETYPVRGIDVSHHQGRIDWDDVSDEDISFVYIKATEGENFRDSLFAHNLLNARRIGLKVGAYHYYLASKDPLKQAYNFISNVPPISVSLPPVLDIELPTDLKTEKSHSQIVSEIYTCLKELEKHYRKKPLIYTDYINYDKYLKTGFAEYDFWIRDIYDTPRFSDGRSWSFWQHSDKGLVKGISGLVDLNVFSGNRGKFDSLYNPVQLDSAKILH